MKRATIAGAVAIALVVLALVVGYRACERDVEPAAPISPPSTPTPALAPAAAPAPSAYQGFLYGRITAVGGATYEGRLRWGRDQEAFWGDYLNGFKGKNPWAGYVPPERLPKERRSLEIFGIKLREREEPADLGRRFMVRFGDIARIEARGRDVRVVLKSGTAFDLDRLEASDFDDGVRVWDVKRGVVDLDSLRIRKIELGPTASFGAVPSRLHGTVRTRHGELTGFVQWDRQEGVGTDDLHCRTASGKLDVRFDSIRSIAHRDRVGPLARLSPGAALVTLQDGREIATSKTQRGDGNHGMYVDDRRYGRVLVSWDAFERIDFSPADSGPAYGDFPPGRPLTGTVTTGDGRHLGGRLVYDLDETVTTETLDAPSQGVDYTIPFGLVASIVPRGREEAGTGHARVVLRSGEELQLERAGDLGDGNAGLLVFVAGQQRPEYVPWTDVERIELDHSPAM